MLSFKKFMHKTEEEKDIQQTLEKLPKLHQNLVKDFKYKLHAGNTLNGDSEHVGYMDPAKKEIAAAAPYRYSREMTILHEIAHVVWDHLMSNELRDKWATIVKRTKNKQNQSAQELFCMAYAATYSHNPPSIHDHPEWNKFILEELPK